MDILWHCRRCAHVQMIDIAHLVAFPADRITISHGYTCEKCGGWEVICYSTSALDEQIRKLLRMRPKDENFSYYLLKAIDKAMQIARRMENRWQEPIPQHG